MSQSTPERRILTDARLTAMRALPLTPELFGAKGDKTRDDTEAVQRAITEAAGTGSRVLLSGGYRCTQPLTLPSGTWLETLPSAELAFSYAGTLLQGAGTEGPIRRLTNTVNPGSRTVVAINHGLVVGDMLRLRSDRVYDTKSTSTIIGELLFVAAVDGDTVTTTTPVQGGPYTKEENAHLSKVTPLTNVSLTGQGTIRGARSNALGQHGLVLAKAVGVRIEGVSFAGIDRRHVALLDCADAWLDRCTFDWAVDDVQGYGVSFANATMDSGCSRSRFLNVRHSLSTNNESTVPGIVRRVRFAWNTIRRSSVALGGSQAGGDSIDTHTAAEDIWIENNHTSGATGAGINFEARSGRVIGNTVRGCEANGINVHNESDLPGQITVTDNEVTGAAGHGIVVRSGSRGTTAAYEMVRCSDNVVYDVAGSGVWVGLAGATRPVETGVTVTDNTVVRAAGSDAVRIEQVAGAVQRGNRGIGGTTRVTVVDASPPDSGVVTLFSGRLPSTGVLAISPDIRSAIIDTFNSAATQELKNITGGTRGQLLTVSTASSSRDVTIAQEIGTLRLPAPCALEHSRSSITLRFDGTSWVEVARTLYPAA